MGAWLFRPFCWKETPTFLNLWEVFYVSSNIAHSMIFVNRVRRLTAWMSVKIMRSLGRDRIRQRLDAARPDVNHVVLILQRTFDQ